MKITIFFSIIFLVFISTSFSQSILNYQAGSGVVVEPGADICADQVVMNGTFSGGGTICGAFLRTLRLTVLLQGFYDPVNSIMVSDTVNVYLRNATIPYTLVDSSRSVLNSVGFGTFNFANANNGTSYYIVLKHRNSIETWSGSVNSFTSDTLSYNFLTAASKAFGSNMILVDVSPSKYAAYSGDVNQDGFIDLTDITRVFNNAASFLTGYVAADVNGDNVVDLTDLILTFNNSSNFVSVLRP